MCSAANPQLAWTLPLTCQRNSAIFHALPRSRPGQPRSEGLRRGGLIARSRVAGAFAPPVVAIGPRSINAAHPSLPKLFVRGRAAYINLGGQLLADLP